jgi:hypothetical protein
MQLALRASPVGGDDAPAAFEISFRQGVAEAARGADEKNAFL